LVSAVFEHFITRDGSPSSGFRYETAKRITLKSLAYDLEPEEVELVDRPSVDGSAVRVTGPFEVMSLGRYATEDWKGYVAANGDGGKLEDYVAVISRLYRPDASLQDSGGILHAVEESEQGALGISVGPISGRVTARQVHDAARDAASSGMNEVHILGWAFEANLGEVTARLEEELAVTIRLVMIRPDTLAEGLKVTDPGSLFSPFALPDVEVAEAGEDQIAITLAQRRRGLRPQAQDHGVQDGRLRLRRRLVSRRGL